MILKMRNICCLLAICCLAVAASVCHAAGGPGLHCRISAIYINDTVAMEGSYAMGINIQDENSKIKIEVIAVAPQDDTSCSSAQYSARLINQNSEWTEWSTQRQYIFYNLKPGTYCFQARAKTSDDMASDPVSVDIKVRQSFWKKQYGLIAIIATTIIAALFIIVRQNGKRETAKVQENLDKCMKTLKEVSGKLQEQQEAHNKNVQVLSLLSKAGQNIIKNFTLKEIYQTTYNEINKFFQIDNIGIGTYNAPHNSLDFSSFIMNGEAMPFARYKLDYENIMEVHCYLNNKTIVLDDYQKQAGKHISNPDFKPEINITGSAVYMPLFDNEMTIGVLTIFNKATSFFSSYHLGIIHNIASYLETAIVNYYTDRKAKRRQKLLEDRTINLQKTNNDLEKSQAQLQTMSVALTNTENSVVIFNKNGNLFWANLGFTKLFGYTLEEYIKDSSYYMDTIKQYEAIPYFIKAFEANESATFSLPHKHKNGNEVWTQTNITPILDKNGNLLQIVAVDTDISTLKEAEKEITKQRNEIEAKNKDLTKSLEYASTIQNALMPGKIQLAKHFPQSFIMIMPKDIVSGDFFWLGEKFGRKYIAHCDCAGHGVPGAFLSMMGKVFLDEILQNLKLEDMPGDIIRMLNDKIYQSISGLHDKVGGIDGMDMSLCMINSRNTVLEYAGAYRPLYMVRNGELNIYNGDKRSVGNTAPGDDYQWENKEILIREGDFLVMCSDGYADQFGEESNKKMGRRNFAALIEEAAKIEDASEIEQFFIQRLIQWRGNQEQIDDVSVSGFRITPQEENKLQYEDYEDD